MTARTRRELSAALFAGVVFAWCAVSAAPGDNQRFSDSLHAAHQGQVFRNALERLNAARPGAPPLDGCSSCHQPQGLLAGLVRERPPVDDGSCGGCHAPSGTADAEPPGLAFVRDGGEPGQERRAAHAGTAEPPLRERLPNGLRASQDGRMTLPLRCAACHPDHKGRHSFLTRRDLRDLEAAEAGLEKARERGELTEEAAEARLGAMTESAAASQPFISDVCMDCHVPDRAVPDADRVLTRFLRRHEEEFLDRDDANLLEPLFRKHPVLRGGDSLSVMPFDPGVRSVVANAMRRHPKPMKRGCTPSCHSEHTGAGSGDP